MNFNLMCDFTFQSILFIFKPFNGLDLRRKQLDYCLLLKDFFPEYNKQQYIEI